MSDAARTAFANARKAVELRRLGVKTPAADVGDGIERYSNGIAKAELHRLRERVCGGKWDAEYFAEVLLPDSKFVREHQKDLDRLLVLDREAEILANAPPKAEPLKPGESAVDRIESGGRLTTADYQANREEIMRAGRAAEIDRQIEILKSTKPAEPEPASE